MPSENLRNLEKRELLKREPTSRKEIGGFLKAAQTYLNDSKQPALSAASRFKLAYDAAHALALTALRTHNYRPSGEKGHRAIVFQTLPHTVSADVALWRTLDKYHTKRNALEYAGLLDVSENEAEDLVNTTEALLEVVLGWLKANKPDLL
jgi:hypothetical protein